jgi:YteA family regulatory protein
MNHLTATQLAELKQMLLKERAVLEQKLDHTDHYGLNSAMSDSISELSAYDNHPGDLATEMYERGKDIALLEQDDLHLARISQALTAMDNGAYGACLTCHQPIPIQRLYALPDTQYCLDHSPRQIVSDRRPAEEDFLTPPFGRTSMDEQSSYNGFDGEDAWQIVEQWGNSDSPAMAENPGHDYEHLMTEADENDGYVESIESFLATDITGRHVAVVRNRAYKQYMENREGDPLLEWEAPGEDDSPDAEPDLR